MKHPYSGAVWTLRHMPRSRYNGILNAISDAPGVASLRKLILTFVLVTLFAGCGGGESNVVTGNRDGVLHYGNGAEPQGLDPHVVTGVPENHIIRALFEGLAVKNPITLEPEPGVAERWEFSDEGRVITFYLNPDAKWSNGDQVTAGDYVWSWHRALHPKRAMSIPTCCSRW